MRTIDTHKTNVCNEALTITVTDEPGAGGACHHYTVGGFDPSRNASSHGAEQPEAVSPCSILFQNGPIPEYGTNGVTQEVLLAIVIDRLECFQAGPYACAENGIALRCARQALDALKSRTAKRIARGVEGTHTV